jgi:hypothetical protein
MKWMMLFFVLLLLAACGRGGDGGTIPLSGAGARTAFSFTNPPATRTISGIASATTVTIDPGSYAAGTDLGNPYPGVTLTTAQGYIL